MAEPRTLDLDAVREADIFSKPTTKTTVKTTPADPPKGGRPKGSKTDPTKAEESKLRGQLDRTLERLAEALEGRDDDELATAIREDAKAIASGLIGLTRQLAPARRILIVAVALAEPALAFGRIGRILLGRLAARQQRRAEAQAASDVAPAPDIFAPGGRGAFDGRQN